MRHKNVGTKHKNIFSFKFYAALIWQLMQLNFREIQVTEFLCVFFAPIILELYRMADVIDSFPFCFSKQNQAREVFEPPGEAHSNLSKRSKHLGILFPDNCHQLHKGNCLTTKTQYT